MNIKGVILDVDGTLTDGKKYYFPTADGLKIAKSFSVRDGKGIDLAKKQGVHVAIITADKWEEITARAKDMGVDDVFYNSHDKIRDAETFCRKYDLKFSELCFVGDDVNDIPILKSVGFPVAVGDAAQEVKDLCKLRRGYITRAFGGNGAVREALDMIMRINNK